jgi:alpha-galactosidase
MLLLWHAASAKEDTNELAGTWIVQPLSPPGVAIADTVTFTKDAQGISGVWRTLINGVFPSNYEGNVTDVTSNNQSITFKVTYLVDDFKIFWTGKFIDKHRLRMTWIGDDGTPIHTRIFERVSAEKLMLLKSNLPKNIATNKLPLPVSRELPDNGLALTPPMGWSSWNHFKESITDKSVRETADVLVSSGLRDAGYTFVNIDDGWQGYRDAKGKLHPNSKFPNMKALADYVHAKGLKLGIYSSPGPITCAGYVGSHGYETADAQTFAQWGVDYLKYDWCASAGDIYNTQAEMQALYQKMGAALQATNRPIVYSLCQQGMYNVGSWGRKVGGNLWRTGVDTIVGKRWTSMSTRFEANGTPEDNGPGGWNDPDMLLIGNGGMTIEEYRTHMTLWAILAAPLILGNDLRRMTDEIKEIILNRDVIAIDQDELGKQGERVIQHGTSEVWTKPLTDGSMAVALFNRGDQQAKISVNWPDLGLEATQIARDLWQHVDLGELANGYSTSVPAHGTVLLRVQKLNK